MTILPDDPLLSGSSVLLTGGQGFVGSWLKDALVSAGARVTLLIRDYHPKLALLNDSQTQKVTNIVRGSLEKRSLIERIMLEKEIQYCFHLAAQSLVNVAESSPRSTFLTNAIGTLNVLEAARKSDSIRGLIIASTDKVYGEPKRLPITEEHPLEPQRIYESSKACADILSRSYFESYGLPIGIARCTNTYGGRDLNHSRIIPSSILSLLRNSSPVVESDGTPVRDYMHVSDAVAAYLAIARNISRPSVKGQAFNFGTGKPTTVRDIVSNILRIFGTKLQPTYLNKPGGIKSQYVSATRAYEALGWRPVISLEEGLERTIEWYKKYEAYLD